MSGDKSISIRWVLFASLASGKSQAKNLLKSEDVLAAIKAIKKLGIKVIFKKTFVRFMEKELMGINTKRGLILIVKILEPWLDLF